MELAPGTLAERGTVLEVAGRPGWGVTRVLLSLLAPLTAEGPVSYLDARGMVSPVAAAELGCDLARLGFVDTTAACAEQWAKALAYLLDGVRGIVAEVPRGIPATALRALCARARSRQRLLALSPLAGRIPSGITAGQIVLLPPLDGQVRARVEGKLARGMAVEGVLSIPSLKLDADEPVRHLVAVQ